MHALLCPPWTARQTSIAYNALIQQKLKNTSCAEDFAPRSSQGSLRVTSAQTWFNGKFISQVSIIPLQYCSLYPLLLSLYSPVLYRNVLPFFQKRNLWKGWRALEWIRTKTKELQVSLNLRRLCYCASFCSTRLHRTLRDAHSDTIVRSWEGSRKAVRLLIQTFFRSRFGHLHLFPVCVLGIVYRWSYLCH